MYWWWNIVPLWRLEGYGSPKSIPYVDNFFGTTKRVWKKNLVKYNRQQKFVFLIEAGSPCLYECKEEDVLCHLGMV